MALAPTVVSVFQAKATRRRKVFIGLFVQESHSLPNFGTIA
jgi:hypothetical protein